MLSLVHSIIQGIMICSLARVNGDVYNILHGAEAAVFPGLPGTGFTYGSICTVHDYVVKACTVAPGRQTLGTKPVSKIIQGLFQTNVVLDQGITSLTTLLTPPLQGFSVKVQASGLAAVGINGTVEGVQHFSVLEFYCANAGYGGVGSGAVGLQINHYVYQLLLL